jgi:hypothetical protein
MNRAGHADARNYGDSPVTRVYVPIASSLFQSCSRTPTLAATKVACIINLRHSFEAPLRVDSGVLATPSQARARDLAPTLCRGLMMQAGPPKSDPRHTQEETPPAPRRRLPAH